MNHRMIPAAVAAVLLGACGPRETEYVRALSADGKTTSRIQFRADPVRRRVMFRYRVFEGDSLTQTALGMTGTAADDKCTIRDASAWACTSSYGEQWTFENDEIRYKSGDTATVMVYRAQAVTR